MTSRSPTPAVVQLPNGRERFGKYEILRRIAVGGMAEIYLARAVGIEGFEKHVVIKRILPQYADNEDFVRMFLDEARLAATLHHSNIVQVFDIGAVDGQYFLSMEFLHGQDVRQLTKEVVRSGKPLPIEHAITIVMGVCAGLQYAHDHRVDGRPLNLVHRDVSPQNIFVTYDGGVKLLDFGIARAESRLTETRGGTLKGKIAYMSPEQCSGLPIDRRSDIFATGILLWELTTGRRLYTGESDFEVLRRIKDEDAPRPSASTFAFPLALERIVLKALKRSPAERYANAEEMQLELESFAREQRLPVSTLGLSRYLRDLFRDKIAAWDRAGNASAEGPATTPSGNLLRTQTSLSGPAPSRAADPALAAGAAAPSMPAPAVLPSLAAPTQATPALDVPELRRSPMRGWIFVALGVAVGSLVTWLVARQPPPTAAVSSPATTATLTESPPAATAPTATTTTPASAPATPSAAAVTPARSLTTPPRPTARAVMPAPPEPPELPAPVAPRPARMEPPSAPAPAPTAKHAETRAPTRAETRAPTHAADEERAVEPPAKPAPRHVRAEPSPFAEPSAPMKRPAPPHHVAAKKTKKPSGSWDPDAMLPP